MMKILFILLILSLVGGIIALRYRKQIQLALYFLKMFRKMRQADNNGKNQIGTKNDIQPNGTLVQCAGCKNWIGENKALKMGIKSFYCSADCMEKSVSVKI